MFPVFYLPYIFINNKIVICDLWKVHLQKLIAMELNASRDYNKYLVNRFLILYVVQIV